jgi:hypothetical protein
MSDQELITPGKRGAPLGHPRWGGRKKTVSRARELAAQYGDPLIWLLRLLKDGTYQQVKISLDGKTKTRVTVPANLELLVDAAKCAMQYIHPRLTATAITNDTHIDVAGELEIDLGLDAIRRDPELCERVQSAFIKALEAPKLLAAPNYPGLREDQHE